MRLALAIIFSFCGRSFSPRGGGVVATRKDCIGLDRHNWSNHMVYWITNGCLFR